MSAHNLRRAPVDNGPLFDLGRYPHQPGSKAAGTSAEAADAIASVALLLREKVMEALREHGALTADQIADVLSRSCLAIRPRVAECHKLGLVRDTGERRVNRSGKRAAVWEVA